jgi:23S rRNA pseudouridine1911/1915/1917 synthase
VVCPPDFAERLDRALARLVPGMSRGEARRLIDAGSVFVDGKRCRVASRIVGAGNVLRYESDVASTATSMSVLHVDRHCLVVDKPPGMPSAPTRRAAAGSALEELRRERHGSLWVVHRLDAGTSGALLFALSRRAARRLAESFRGREVEKSYLAWVAGSPANETGVVEAPIRTAGTRAVIDAGGRRARTQWSVVRRSGACTLVRLEPTTGRMHQLRVHMASIGHPIVGDRLYGGLPAPRLMLHAERLRSPHPADGRPVVIEAPAGAAFMQMDTRAPGR